MIFNIVFFVTLLSLMIQGTTVISSARKLHLISDKADEETDFGVELPEELPTSLTTMTLTEADLDGACTLRDMKLPKGTLVMMIKRGGQYIVPNGDLQLKSGDSLLIIKEDSTPERIK